MTKRKPLKWHGGSAGWPIRTKCMAYMQTPGLVEARESVGIEHDKGGGQLIRETVDAYHASGHKP